MRIANWTQLTSSQLWDAYRSQFTSLAEAEATAIFTANRLAKDHFRSTRRAFYEVKESFIRAYQTNLIEGRVARVERRLCRDCSGSGDDGGGWCDRCEGSGVWSERTLFSHVFVIVGQRYSFHSYERPVRLLDEPGEDREEYGGRFTEAETSELLLPMSGLLRMLRWVAAAKGFKCADKPVAHVQDVLEVPVEVVARKFREDVSGCRENCYCRYDRRRFRASV